MKRVFCLLVILLILSVGDCCYSHCLWLNVAEDSPEAGEKVNIGIGWGHKFPKDEVIKEGLLKEIYVLDSTGRRLPVRRIDRGVFEFSPMTEGIYTLLATINPGFLSKTTGGYKLKSKKDLKDVISCFRFDMRAKSLICVGTSGKMPEKCAGDPLEIVPLKNPGELSSGGILPLKLLFHGKPLPNAEVKATYQGFSDQPNTYAVSTKTDRDGVAELMIEKKGYWIVNVLHEIPYFEPEECDKIRYNCSFTFSVD